MEHYEDFMTLPSCHINDDIYLAFNVTFNTVQITSKQMVLWAEETTTFYCATIAYHVGLNALLVAARNYDQRLRKNDIYSWP